MQQLAADDNQTRSEQGGQQQLLLPCPMLLHIPLSPSLNLNVNGFRMPNSNVRLLGQGMQAAHVPASKKQLTFRAFTLSLRGAGRKRPYSQEQYTASNRTQPLDYYDVWDMAEVD